VCATGDCVCKRPAALLFQYLPEAEREGGVVVGVDSRAAEGLPVDGEQQGGRHLKGHASEKWIWDYLLNSSCPSHYGFKLVRGKYCITYSKKTLTMN